MKEIILYFIIIFSPLARATWDIWSQTLLLLCALLIYGLWLIRYKDKELMLRKSSLNTPVLIFMIIMLISFWVAPVRYNWRTEFFNLLSYILIFYYIASTIIEKRSLVIICRIIVLSATIVSITAFVQYARGVGQISSTMVNPNILAGYIIGVLPLSIACLIKEFMCGRDRKRHAIIIYSICTILMLSCLISTRSTGAIISVCIALVIMVYISVKAGLIKLQIKKIRLIGTLFIVMVSIISTVVIYYKIKDPFVLNRLNWWHSALAMIFRNPFTGVGLGSFGDAYTLYKIKGLNSLYAHNHFLQVGAETGILGLGAFVWVIFIFTRTSLNAITKESAQDSAIGRFLLTGLFSGTCAILIFNIIDYSLSIPANALLFWIMIALITGSTGAVFYRVSLHAGMNKIRLLLFALIVIFSGIVLKPFIASQKLVWGSNLLRQGKFNEAQTVLQKSVSIDSFNAESHVSLSKVYAIKTETDKAVDELKIAIQLNPYKAEYHYNIAQLYMVKNQWDMAIKECRNAIELHPQRAQYHNALARIYKQMGMLRESQEAYMKAAIVTGETDANGN